MTKSEEKKMLRASIRTEIPALSEKYVSAANEKITSRLAEMPEYLSAGTVFCFVGTPQEINTRPFLETVLAAGKTLCVPLCVGHGRMVLKKITALNQLVPGAYGSSEPSGNAPTVSPDDVDFSVIPCISCDRAGHRLGQGGGFYDRFLTVYRGPAVLVCRERLMREEIPVEPHDAMIHWVLTEKGLYEDGVPSRIE